MDLMKKINNKTEIIIRTSAHKKMNFNISYKKEHLQAFLYGYWANKLTK
jgi:hypothetical protein